MRPGWAVERTFTKGTTSIALDKVAQRISSEPGGRGAGANESYERVSNALNSALNEQLEAEFQVLRRAYMSPSCEHAAVLAVRFLGGRAGSRWLAAYASS